MSEQAVLITGAAKRFGAELAVFLATKGFDILLHYNTSSHEVASVKKKIKAQGRQVFDVQFTFSANADYAKLVSYCLTQHTNIVAVVNNASLFEYDLPNSVTNQSLVDHFVVNCLSATQLANAYLELSNTAVPTVINILDNKIHALNYDYFAYTISKCALKTSMEMQTKFYPHAKIYGVAPSMMLESGSQTIGRVKELTKINPLNINITSELVCQAIYFLLQKQASSGQILTVDGGQSLMELERDVAFLTNI